MSTYSDVKLVDGTWVGHMETSSGHPMGFQADPSMFLIREAWHQGLDLEAEADGFGPGVGTHGDWSGIRDSSHEAIEVMLTKTLNFLFGKPC